MSPVLKHFIIPIPLEYAVEDIEFFEKISRQEIREIIQLYFKLGVLVAEEHNDGIEPVIRIHCRY